MPRPPRPAPRDLVESWPDVAASDSIVEVARRFAVNLREAIGAASVRQAGERCGVDHTTILAIIGGRSWPDLATIARLESGLAVSLWPGVTPKNA